jgi:hypothetical protein
MDSPSVIAQLQEAAKQIALQMMKMHPAVRKLPDESARDDCLKSLHEMTVQLESIKKRLIRIQQRDDSSLL